MTHTNDLAAIVEYSETDSWVIRAACGDLDLDQLDLFFVDAGRTLSKDATALCRGCVVRNECLDHAYRRDIGGGYFGGVSPSKRRSSDQRELTDD